MSNYWQSFVEQNKNSWHFDPSVKSEDFTYTGRLKTDFKPLLDLMSDDKNFKEHISTQQIKGHGAELNERIKAINEWGFNDHNTKSLQIMDSEFPEIFEPYKKFAGFRDCKVVALKQYPGQFLPWHQDLYFGFKEEFDVPDDVKITRYSLFLQDWQWGHFFSAGNCIMHQWKQGDIIELEPKIHHATCNAGMVPKLTMTITGTITDESIERKKSKVFTH